MAIKVPAGRCVECYAPTGNHRKKRCPLHARANKYKAQATDSAGLRFDSKKEARRHSELTMLQDGGHIEGLERQVAFPLLVNGVRVATYVADFVYTEKPSGRRVVEDAKGYRNAYYRLKARLFRACNGFPITEV